MERPKSVVLEEAIQKAIEQARAVCAAEGVTSPACAAAWDVVEELQAEASHQLSRQHPKVKTSLEEYCEANPDAPECRMYED